MDNSTRTLQVLTNGALATRLLMLQTNIRKFSKEDRNEILNEAAIRLNLTNNRHNKGG